MFSPRRTSYLNLLRKKFLRTLNANEQSVKVITTWRAGDLFVGSPNSAKCLEKDPDLLGFGGRRWGGGNGYGEGFANFDPIEAFAFKPSKEEVKQSQTRSNDPNFDDDETTSEINTSDPFFWEEGGCVFPCLCTRYLRNQRAVVAWLVQICAVLGFFAAAVYFSFASIIWEGVPAWCYMVMAGLVIAIPIVCWMIVHAFIRIFKSIVRANQNPKKPEQSEYLLNWAYLGEKMSANLVVLLTFFFWTISFLLLFANYPKDNPRWDSGYKNLSAILGTLTVWALGTVFVQYLTHTITREVNVHALGTKVRNVLRAEVALWRIVGLIPDATDLKLYSLMNDPFLVYDPRKAGDLAKALVKTPMSGKYQMTSPIEKLRVKAVDVKIETDRHAALLGSWAYLCLMKGSLKPIYKQGKISLATSRWRSSSQNLLVAHDALIDDYYSNEEAALSTFKTMQRAALERHSVPEDFNLSPAHFVFPELDLAVLSENLKHGIALASEFKWTRWGTVRGIPKRFITKSDLEASLRNLDPHFTVLPEANLDQAWDFLDPEHVGKITQKRAKNAVKGLVEDRKNLKTTLENTAGVVDKLRVVIATGVNFFVFLCALAIFGLNVLEVWVGISSILLAFSFVFGGTLKGVFDSVVFLFGVHPYDVGDKVKLGPTEDVYWIKRISLMSTQMTRWDGASVRFMNPYLFNIAPLINVRRSGNHERTISIFIDAATLPSKIELEKMQAEFELFLARSPGAYSGSCSITARDIIQPLHVKITIWWAFAYPDLDSGRTFRDTSKFIQFILATLRKRNIKVSGVHSGTIDLEKGGAKKVAGLQGGPGTTRII